MPTTDLELAGASAPSNASEGDAADLGPAFPPPGVTDARGLRAAIADAVSPLGIERDLFQEVGRSTAAQLESANDRNRRAYAWRLSLELVGAANRALRARKSPRIFRQMLPPGASDLRSAQWFLVDVAGAEALTRRGYRSAARAAAPSLSTLPLALLALGLGVMAVKTGSNEWLVAAFASYALWFGARLFLRSRGRRG
jgi:hypothetical protein